MNEPQNGGMMRAEIEGLRRDYNRHDGRLDTHDRRFDAAADAYARRFDAIEQDLRKIGLIAERIDNVRADLADIKANMQWLETFKLSQRSFTESRQQNSKTGLVTALSFAGTIILALLLVLINLALKGK